MADEILFYTNPMSRGRIARWMLEEIGAPYRTEVLQFGTTMKDDSYKAVNPMGKVPTIVHGKKTVTECAAICAYLADAFPEKGLAPSPADRADYYRWMFFAAGPLEAAVSNRALGFEVPPGRERMIGYGSFADVMDALEFALRSNSYIAGEKFSAADVYVGSQIGWGLQFGSIEKRPAFEQYFGRIALRDAYQRAVEKDDLAASAL
ncbi:MULTISPECIES: glutathione S-transferase family protein [Rhizobiaceae]|jgi:glutathione S-transferase|uniref:Glutathione S-transferase n=1 Tax=Aliirhizobium cellulosilyticum TaxID=393664 RepID=A0A7W6TAB8_9HYPH|nr:glutathione S-transferase family protein [Rhizobium cellulosilyticum]MBB4347878.1 glutathione S-transferase [Rhizobium cellulosilyticum]MBB4409728.1 glutathione S-transferase [Rhizobium cellulosilyticum]MBB4444415.1 glutathione S-transferase [Rhizobium cellulosilyticum]